MELPIQLKFFRKIELYQEYKFEEEKASHTKLQDWKIEKEILKWTRNHHHHLGSPLTSEGIKSQILKNQHSHEHNHAMESLVQRGFATTYSENAIKITKEGLIMGEVIFEVEDRKFLSKLKYQGFFWLVWLTAITGALTVIINFFKLLSN